MKKLLITCALLSSLSLQAQPIFKSFFLDIDLIYFDVPDVSPVKIQYSVDGIDSFRTVTCIVYSKSYWQCSKVGWYRLKAAGQYSNPIHYIGGTTNDFTQKENHPNQHKVYFYDNNRTVTTKRRIGVNSYGYKWVDGPDPNDPTDTPYLPPKYTDFDD